MKKRIYNIMSGSLECGRLVRYFVLCAVAAVSLPAQTFTNLFSFNGSSQGYGPSGLSQGNNGNLYGTSAAGGSGTSVAAGTIFRITRAGALTTIFNFACSPTCPDGNGPIGPLVQDTPVLALNGNLYGTTSNDGAHGAGTIFEITPSGSFTVLHSFDNLEVALAEAPLIQASNGVLYGTTPGGGANNGGSVFQITQKGVFTTLYSFCAQPGCTDGNKPQGLVQGTDGNLYGVTFGDGIDKPGLANPGTIFKITPSGAFTNVYTFDFTNGFAPAGALVQANDGNFYGIASMGGLNQNGTIFKMSPSGSVTTAYSFCPAQNCQNFIQQGLMQDTNGQFYGTIVKSAASPGGEIFSFSEGLSPFVTTAPTTGFSGTIVRILGTNLTNTSGVTFNGTPALFGVISPSEIVAQVPAGAKSGIVQVVTHSGTLLSNVPFRVL